MARWDDGYVTDTVYTSQFHREITPIWLSTAATLLGHRTPDLADPFRYADLGCGNGVTALMVAATMPQAEIWGFDFNPAHIEFATSVAARAGFRNAHFVETPFQALAQTEPAAPDFDFIVSHGVLSWISRENQQHLFDVVSRRLKPGGLAYLSYNVATGAGAMLPLQTLMRLAAEASPARSDLAMPAILDMIDRLKEGGAAFFKASTAIEARLRDIRSHSLRYLAHEYLNRNWHSLMFADVADAMAEAKCTFIGSATLSENIDATSAPAGMVALMTEAKTQRLRETMRDLATAQSFRRDIYRRGAAPALPGEQQARLDALTLTWTGLAVGDNVTINTGIGALTGRPDLYKPLLEKLRRGPATVSELARGVPFAMPEVLQAITLLLGAGYANPMLSAPVVQAGEPRAQALNRVIGQLNSSGADIHSFAAAPIGSALQCDLLETLVIAALLDNTPPTVAALAPEALRRLAIGGRNVQQDGQPVTDPAKATAVVSNAVQGMLNHRQEIWRRAGILP